MAEIKFLDIYKIDQHDYQIKRSIVLENLNYIFDNDLSNKDMHIYYKQSCETVIVIINGINKCASNMIHDININNINDILQYLKDRYESTKEVYQKINIKYPIQKQISIGHSLGGALVCEVPSKNSIIYTFNKFIIKPNLNLDHVENLINFRTYFDIHSFLTLLFENKNTKNFPIETNINEILFSSPNIIGNIISLFIESHKLCNFHNINISIP